MILVFCEATERDGQDGLATTSRQALALARTVGPAPVTALVVDDGVVNLDEVAVDAGHHGAVMLHVAVDDLLAVYGPESHGTAVATVAAELAPDLVLAAGTDRGGEVLAQAAARQDLPLVANVTALDRSNGGWNLQRVRWSGSLVEHARLDAESGMVTMLPHAVAASPVSDPVAAGVVEHVVGLDDVMARSRVVDEVVTSTGMSLATAPVVVGGGRGVGSADGFAPLERLAELLGGAVGCSRVATNNGWRPHRDQVGQTGTAIAPTIYIACGISGAIQHWAGAKSATHVLAVNTDAQASMVTRADWAVIGDLHQFVPALIDAIEAR